MSRITIKKETSSDMKINSCNSEIHHDIVKKEMKINICKSEAKEFHSGSVKKETKSNSCNSEAKEIRSDIGKKKRKMNSCNSEIRFDIVKKKGKINSKAKDIVKKISRCNSEFHSDIVKKEEMKIDSCDTEIHSDIVFEVLTRLPIKDLDRFKCVSPSWSSMTRCPEFMKAHTACAGIFIHILPIDDPLVYNRIPNSTKGLLYASMDAQNEVFAQRLSLPYLSYRDITPVVNGLACLYTGHKASLFNISTREIMELPSSSLYSEGRSVWYALGFDPMDNVYKLLKVCTISNQLVYEILTLETSSTSSWRWREIVQQGLRCFSSVSVQSYFLNGMIYCKFITQDFRGVRKLLAFDVHLERFTIFNPPSVPSSIALKFSCNFTVFGQFEGRLALARVLKTQFETVLEVWALEDHQNSLWSKHKIDMPDEMVGYFSIVTPIGNLPSGELLLYGASRGSSFFIYDPTNKKYRKLMVELPLSLYYLAPRSCSAHITWLSEKITPLDVILGLTKK